VIAHRRSALRAFREENLSAAQAKLRLAKVRPRDALDKTRRRGAAEPIADLEWIHANKTAADRPATGRSGNRLCNEARR